MLDSIVGLIDVIGWLIAIGALVFGFFSVFSCFAEKRIGQTIKAIVAIVLAVIAFFKVNEWLGSIGFSIFAAGLAAILTCLFGEGGSSTSSTKPKQSEGQGPTFGEAFLDSYCEYELTKAAVKDAIREEKHR